MTGTSDWVVFSLVSFPVLTVDFNQTTKKKKREREKKKKRKANTATQFHRMELIENLILGLMPSVDGQQHNFQAGIMRHVLPCGCNLSLQEEPRC